MGSLELSIFTYPHSTSPRVACLGPVCPRAQFRFSQDVPKILARQLRILGLRAHTLPEQNTETPISAPHCASNPTLSTNETTLARQQRVLYFLNCAAEPARLTLRFRWLCLVSDRLYQFQRRTHSQRCCLKVLTTTATFARSLASPFGRCLLAAGETTVQTQQYLRHFKVYESAAGLNS